MTDAIRRSLGKEHDLNDVGGLAAPPEVLAKRTMTQKNNVVAGGVFLIRGTAATRSAMVIAHPNKGAVVQQVKRERKFGLA
jgi:hypothetical protein